MGLNILQRLLLVDPIHSFFQKEFLFLFWERQTGEYAELKECREQKGRVTKTVAFSSNTGQE